MITSIITASYDKQVRFWDPNSGRTIRNFVFQDSQINALSLSPDRCRLAVAGYGIVRYYDVASSSQVPPLTGSFECSSASNFTTLGHIPLANASGALLFTGSEDGVLRILDPRTPSSMRLLREFATGIAITCSTLSPDNVLLITGSQIGKVTVWHCPSLVADAASSNHSAAATKPLQEISFAGDHCAIRSIAVSPLVHWVAVATNTGKVHCLQFASVARTVAVRTQQSGPHIRSQSEITSAAIPSNSESTSVTGGSTNDVAALAQQVDELSSASPSAGALGAPREKVSVLLTPLQQQYLFERVQSITCHHKYILKVAISPDGKLLATCSADYTVGLWQVPTILEKPTETAPAGAGSPAGVHDAQSDFGSPGPALSHTAAPSPKNFPSVLPASPGGTSAYEFIPLRSLQGHTRWVWDCAFSPCSTALVSVSSDNHVRLWSSIGDKPRSDVFVGHNKPVVAVVLDIDRRRAET